MTRKKAFELAMQACKETWNEKTCAEIIKALEQEPTDDATLKDIFCMGCEYKEQEPCEKVAQERYADLCEYFGGAKDILKSRKDFKAWLERVKWHIHKAEELYEKYEYKKEPCEDAISRQAVLEKAGYTETEEGWCGYTVDVDYIKSLPPITPRQKMGQWIRVDKDKCKCDQCEVISFIAMYPNGDKNYCPNCGTKMVEQQKGAKNE